MDFEYLLIPIFVCVVLPVAIVWIISTTKKHEMDRKTDMMMKAYPAGSAFRGAVLLFYMEDRPVKEIAGILSCPGGTVKTPPFVPTAFRPGSKRNSPDRWGSNGRMWGC